MSALGAVGAAALSSAGGYFEHRGARRNMKTGIKMQQDFSERMSNSAYQRSVVDMKKAGINPMLAYMQGGASTPSGGSQSASGGPDMGGAVSSALSASKIKPELDLMASQEGVNSAQKAKTITEEKLTKVAIKRAKAELLKFKQSGSGVLPNTLDMLRKQLPDLPDRVPRAKQKKDWKKVNKKDEARWKALDREKKVGRKNRKKDWKKVNKRDAARWKALDKKGTWWDRIWK